MKKVLVFGATGLVGRKLVRQLLEDKRYVQVITPVRQHTDFIHAKLVQLTIDFNDPAFDFPEADEVFCCIGSTMKQAKSRAAFKKIDHDLVLAIAQKSKAKGIQKFALISAISANSKSVFFYNRVKSAIEISIIQLGFESTIIARPSILSGTRDKIRWGESITELLMRIFSFLLPKKYRPISSYLVAKSLIEAINNPNNKAVQIITSDQMQF